MAYLCLSRRKLLAIEIGMKCISSKLIIKPNQNTIPIFHPIVPDEEKMMKTIKIVGTTKPNEIIEGEIIRNSEDEEKR